MARSRASPRAAPKEPFAARPAVGYLRRSTDRQEQSIPDQQRAIERYAAEHGIELLRFYTDDAISGTSTEGRKAFQELIDDASSAECDFGLVVVYDVKRFGRVDNDEAGYYRHILRQNGVEVRYASEGFAGDSSDDLLRPVKQWQARQESKDLAKVVIRGMVSKASSGADPSRKEPRAWWMGGAPPFGYDLRYESQAGDFLFTVRYERDGSKALLDVKGKKLRVLQRGETIAASKRDRCRLIPGAKDRVEVVRQIYRLYLEERRGFKAIADLLNREGTPTARGPEWASIYSGLWAMTTVRAILVQPAYAGDFVWNRRSDARFFRISGDGKAVERGEAAGRRLTSNDQKDWMVTRDAHPALVSRADWETAQSLIHAAAESSGGSAQRIGVPAGGWKGPRSRFVLSGLVRCSKCGSRYEGSNDATGTKKSGEARATRGAYVCGGYIRRGPSVCRRGTVGQRELEAPVLEALGRFYERYQGVQGHKRLARAVEGYLGGQEGRVAEKRAAIDSRLEKISVTTRNLLDHMTKAMRPMVERRIAELESERRDLEREAAALERLARAQKEAREVLESARGFVETLPTLLSSEKPDERQAAVRRCVKEVVYDDTERAAMLTLRAVPLFGVEPEQEAVETVRLSIAGRGRRGAL